MKIFNQTFKKVSKQPGKHDSSTNTMRTGSNERYLNIITLELFEVIMMAKPVKLVIAKQLAGKKVISNEGEELGKLVDVYIQETTGKLENLLLEPNPDSVTVRQLQKEEGLVLVPYSAVMSIGDYIIVDRKVLAQPSSSFLEGYE